MKSFGLTADVCLSAGMSWTLCQCGVLEKTFKQVLTPALCWAIPWCSASLGHCFGPSWECSEFPGCPAALVCGAFRKDVEFLFAWWGWGQVTYLFKPHHVPVELTWCFGSGTSSLGTSGVCCQLRSSPLAKSLGQAVLGPWPPCFQCVFCSPSHPLKQQAVPTNKTWRHQAVCVIRLMIESMLDWLTRPFKAT